MGLTAHLATALFDHCSSGPHELWCHSEVCLVPGGRESGGHCKELVRIHNLDTLSGISLLSLPLSFSCHLSPVVSKASSGAMELMQVYSVGSMTTFLKVGVAMVVP